jgi:hypothetical protein
MGARGCTLRGAFASAPTSGLSWDYIHETFRTLPCSVAKFITLYAAVVMEEDAGEAGRACPH